MLTSGYAADSPVAPDLLAGLKGARYLLADKGYDADAIRTTIHTGRSGVMPHWGGRLDPATIKMLAAYVHSLGGGEGEMGQVKTAQR